MCFFSSIKDIPGVFIINVSEAAWLISSGEPCIVVVWLCFIYLFIFTGFLIQWYVPLYDRPHWRCQLIADPQASSLLFELKCVLFNIPYTVITVNMNLSQEFMLISFHRLMLQFSLLPHEVAVSLEKEALKILHTETSPSASQHCVHYYILTVDACLELFLFFFMHYYLLLSM